MPNSTTAEPGNNALSQALLAATGLEIRWTTDVRANLFGWLVLAHPGQLVEVAKALDGRARLCTVTAYALVRDDEDKRRHIAYHFASGDTLLTVTVPLYDSDTSKKLPIPSITPWFRNADWNEREFREMYNIDILDHPNPRRLFLDERLDAGIMTRLIPFSAMANSAGTNTLWERILEAKGVPPEERRPSVSTPAEPIKTAPAVTPVEQAADRADTEAKEAALPGTLAAVALSPEDFAAARAKEKAAGKIADDTGTAPVENEAEAPKTVGKAKNANKAELAPAAPEKEASKPVAAAKAAPKKKPAPKAGPDGKAAAKVSAKGNKR